MKKTPTDKSDSTVPEEPERFRLWGSIKTQREALTLLIEQGHEDADLYRAVRAQLDKLGTSERPPSDKKLRELDEVLARKSVMLWLSDRKDAEALEVAEGFVSRFRDVSVDLKDAYSKVVAQIQEGRGNTSNTHDNIATRIVRKLYQD